MRFCEVISSLTLYLFLFHCVKGEISDKLKAAIDGFSASFDELYPLKEDKKTEEAAVLQERVEEDETVDSVQQAVNEPPLFKETASERGGTIIMNITPEAKEFAHDALVQVDPSLVLRDVKNFTAEVINGIKYTLTVEIENGDHNIKTCNIELFEPAGKNNSKVTWNDCLITPSVPTDSEVVSPSAIPDSEAVPPSMATDSEAVSPSTTDDSKLVPPSVAAEIEAIPPCATTDSEVSTTEQQSVDYYTTVIDNTGTNNDDVSSSRKRRETLESRGFSDIGSKVAHELGNFALDTLDAIDADSNKRVVEKIQSAQKELVDGLPLYEIVMLVRETQCPENSPKDCTFSNTDPQQLCSVTLQSSLDNKSPVYARVVKSECKVADPVTINNGEPQQISVKREH